MYKFDELNGFLYAGDFLFLAALATIIIKLKLEKSCQGFSAKTQGVYGVVVCTRNIDLIFVEGPVYYIIYCIVRKISNISCIIYIVIKITRTSKNDAQCNCNQDSFWVEALVVPCIIVTAVLHYGESPEEVLWSFSIYLEAVAMVPQFYLIHVRGKGDSYLNAYVSLMAAYSLTDALAFSLNAFIYHKMSVVWPACKCFQLAMYIWYILIPREAILPVANCEERRRRPTLFMRQQSLLAQTLLQKTNSSSDFQVFAVTTPRTSLSTCSTISKHSLDGNPLGSPGDSPPPTPCVKFDPTVTVETFRLKAPKLTMKQLKNKGSLQLKSLPSSPVFARKSALLKSSASVASFRSISELNDINLNAHIRSNRKRRMGLSLPSSPDAEKRSENKFNSGSSYYKSIEQLSTVRKEPTSHMTKKLRSQKKDVSSPTTPECRRKPELILRADIAIPLYDSLSHLPRYYGSSRSIQPSSPRLDDSQPSTPDVESNSMEYLEPQIHPAQKPERPPQPKFTISPPATPIQDKKIIIQSSLTESKTALKTGKPKRPPLPKLVLSNYESATEFIYRF